ncbi:MAG: hypothetical protein MZV65_02400 [Chromatiales bacterium]|nr:hypothetical protein [Chromatiales bacterium]
MKVRLLEVTNDDLPLIERWLHADHVRGTWGDPDANLRLLREPPADGQLAGRIIEADGRKVGIVLWQHPTREELDVAGLTDIPTSVIDIDIMIGELRCARTGAWVGRDPPRRRGSRLSDPDGAVRDGVRPAGQSGLAAGFRQGGLPQGQGVRRRPEAGAVCCWCAAVREGQVA